MHRDSLVGCFTFKNIKLNLNSWKKVLHLIKILEILMFWIQEKKICIYSEIGNFGSLINKSFGSCSNFTNIRVKHVVSVKHSFFNIAKPTSLFLLCWTLSVVKFLDFWLNSKRFFRQFLKLFFFHCEPGPGKKSFESN